MTDTFPSLVALIGAITSAFAGNQGGVALALLLIAMLAWRLRRCEHKHEVSDAQNQRLTIALVQLATVINAQAGTQIVQVAPLEEMLQGKPAVRYAERSGPGRREADKGRTDGKDDAAGGAGDVPR